MKYACLFGSGPVPWRNITLVLFSFAMMAFSQKTCSQSQYSGNTRYPSKHRTYLLLNEVNRQAAKHFRDNFSTDGTEHWLREQNYLVASLSNGALRQKVYYTRNGAFKCVIKTYDEEPLGRNLKSTIHKKFEDYDIRSVTEISNLERSVYFIKIVSPDYIKTLKYQEGKLEVTENFINGGL